MSNDKWDRKKIRTMRELFDEYDWENTCRRCKEIIRILGHDIPIAKEYNGEERKEDNQL